MGYGTWNLCGSQKDGNEKTQRTTLQDNMKKENQKNHTNLFNLPSREFICLASTETDYAELCELCQNKD